VDEILILMLDHIQLFRETSEKNEHVTTPKGNMGYDQYTVSDTEAFALSNIRRWPHVSFFQISLKNSEHKTTHNTFRNCPVHFYR